ncbi:MAG TPA: FtsH protease activity modulator HflK [Burkholderiales bacterium]
MGLNDPQWGKRGGGSGGPPDLDELWRQFNRRLNSMFGRRGGDSGGPSEPGPGSGISLPSFKGGPGLVLGLIAIAWLASGFYIVDASQRGVVLRFGKFLETTMPGPRWHLPFPIESAEVVNVSQVRTVEIGYRNNVRSKVLKEALMLTDDENIVDVQFAVQYIIKDAGEWLFNNRNPEETVKQVAESAIREVVGRSKMDYVIYQGREQVAADSQKIMQEIMDRYLVGVQVSRVNMQNAQPPEQVQAAFDDAVKAGQDRERLKNEAEAYANDVIPKARGTASRLMQEAEGHRQRVVANAEGEAARFKQLLPEYAKAPGVTRERLYLDTMQQVLSSTSKVVAESKQGGNILFLPLDKILQMTGAQPGAEAATPVKPANQEPAPEGGQRSREAFRSRERETR